MSLRRAIVVVLATWALLVQGWALASAPAGMAMSASASILIARACSRGMISAPLLSLSVIPAAYLLMKRRRLVSARIED
jgi:Cu/Ag efflux pump CusA